MVCHRILKQSLLNLLQYCFCFMFWFLTLGMWDLSSLTRDQTLTSCFERQSLNLWTPREVLSVEYWIQFSLLYGGILMFNSFFF